MFFIWREGNTDGISPINTVCELGFPSPQVVSVGVGNLTELQGCQLPRLL